MPEIVIREEKKDEETPIAGVAESVIAKVEEVAAAAVNTVQEVAEKTVETVEKSVGEIKPTTENIVAADPVPASPVPGISMGDLENRIKALEDKLMKPVEEAVKPVEEAAEELKQDGEEIETEIKPNKPSPRKRSNTFFGFKWRE